MRPSTTAPTDRHVREVDRPQAGLFGEELPDRDPRLVKPVPSGDAGVRRARRRAVATDPKPITGEPLQVPIDQLIDDAPNAREHYPQESLDGLAKDIAERGMLQAIVVAPSDAQGRYRIRFGLQRWRAARLAGLTVVPVAVRAQPCEGYDQVAENLKRHGLSPLELARFIRSRVDAGESNAYIAKRLAVDQTTVAYHLTLLELPPVLAAALESGRCSSPRTLHELQRLHAEQPDAVTALMAGDLPVTRDAVAALRSPAAKSEEASAGAPRDRMASLISRSQALCDRLDRLLALLADTGRGDPPCEPLVALRQRLKALVQRLGG